VDIDLLWLVLIVTPLVMAVIILVIGVLFFRALREPTRDALARQRAQQEAGGSPTAHREAETAKAHRG